jgi:hypothetical protein
MEHKGDYRLIILNLEKNTTFTKFIKNEYFLRKFRNKCRFSKKIRILSEIKMY